MALIGGGSDREKEFAEFCDARGESYHQLVRKYDVKPIENVHYIVTGRDRFLISSEDLARMLHRWHSCTGLRK